EHQDGEDEHRYHFHVRCGEGRDDRRIFEQSHPGDKRDELAGDGAEDPGAHGGPPQPVHVGDEFAGLVRRELERHLRPGVAQNENAESDHVETRSGHAKPPASATPPAISVIPAILKPSSRSWNNSLPASITTTMLMEPISI